MKPDVSNPEKLLHYAITEALPHEEDDLQELWREQLTERVKWEVERAKLSMFPKVAERISDILKDRIAKSGHKQEFIDDIMEELYAVRMGR